MTLSVVRIAAIVALCVFSAEAARAQTPPVVSHERELIGHTWSGGTREVVPGFEGQGGGFIREGLAISFMQGIQDRRQWIMVAKREVGRDGRNAVWLATDAERGTAKSAESFIAFGCQIMGSGTEESQTGLIGVVGSERVGSQGMLRAELAWQLAEDGSLTAVTQLVACYDESEGV